MPDQDLAHELDQNAKRTRRAAAILAVLAALVWGAAAVLTSQATATTVVDGSTPVSDAPSAPIDQSPAVPPTEPETEPPQPQAPVGGNGDLAPTPTTDPPSCDDLCLKAVDLHPLEVQIIDSPVGIRLAVEATDD